MVGKTQRQSFEQEGFYCFEQVLTDTVLQYLGVWVEEQLQQQSDQHFKEQKSSGSMINILADERFADLIAHPQIGACFRRLGFSAPKWSSGFIISKPGHSPPLFWHQDWWAWNHASSYQRPCPMAFVMVYLVDTKPDNGCLKVIPKSHVQRQPVHDVLTETHAYYRRMDDPDHPAYQAAGAEVDVAVQAGDVIIGDARLLHAAHANHSDERRSVITLWYFPDFDHLPEAIKASIDHDGRHGWPQHWSVEALKKIAAFKPEYRGTAEAISWNRIPDERLT